MKKFLEFDRGRKDHTITCRVQYELLEKIEELSDNNVSQYVRELLIMHIRDHMDQ